MKTLEEEIYLMNERQAREMLNVFAEDENSVRYILNNLFSGVREAILRGGARRNA